MIVVVLGMHRSGTSLVSSMLHVMGVRMGEPEHLERSDPGSQPHGYWEDQDFVALNRQIIAAAGGHWHEPPAHANILQASRRFSRQMAGLVESKADTAHKLNLLAMDRLGPHWLGWGWKDPRSCLTMDAWWPYIKNEDVRIVRVRRRQEAIIDSLIRRGEKLGAVGPEEQRQAWVRVINMHENRVHRFLLRSKLMAQTAEVEYEQLVRKDGAPVMLTRIATLLGLEARQYVEAIRAATARIEFRG